VPATVKGWALTEKRKEWKLRGRVTHGDCSYLASCILNGCHGLAVRAILARRFPVICIDEFQDTDDFLVRAVLALLAEPKVEAPAPAPEPAPVPAPAPEPVKEEAKPVPPPAPQKFILDEASLHFGNGKADLDAAGTAAIQKLADSLKAFTGKYTVVVTGYTSAVGGKAFNKALSKKRAEAVAKVLVDAGVPAAAVTSEGAGPEKPLADDKTQEGQAKNRRVEIEVKAEGAHVEVHKPEPGVKLEPDLTRVQPHPTVRLRDGLAVFAGCAPCPLPPVFGPPLCIWPVECWKRGP